MNIRYRVDLSQIERIELRALLSICIRLLAARTRTSLSMGCPEARAKRHHPTWESLG
jgi:hypothetical protein